MRTALFLSWRRRPMALIGLAVACLAVWNVAFPDVGELGRTAQGRTIPNNSTKKVDARNS